MADPSEGDIINKMIVVGALAVLLASACETSETRLRNELEQAHAEIDRLQERVRDCKAELSTCESERDDCEH